MFQEYYTATYLLSKGALFNLCVSDRSDGKSFNIKARNLEAFDTQSKVFVYMRRFKTEITEKLYKGYFDEVLRIESYKKYADKYTFKYTKSCAYAALKPLKGEKPQYKPITYFIPLSCASQLKSQIDPVDISEVNFDEYIPLNGRYIQDEMVQCLEFWKSCDRDREIIKFNFFGNRISRYCPFMAFFNLNIDLSKERIETYKNNTVAIQSYGSKEHRQQRKRGKFADLVEGTEYASYDQGGILEAIDIKIEPLSKNTSISNIAFHTVAGDGTIYISDDKLYISDKKQSNPAIIITDTVIDTKGVQLNIKDNTNNAIKLIKTSYYQGKIVATSNKALVSFSPIINSIL